MASDLDPGRRRSAPKGSGGTEVHAPSITLPKGGGAIRGIGEKFAANPVTGTGSLSVPIATSPGRSGFGPQLFLSYDSGVGNGPFGFGWHLSIPSITRKIDKGLPRYRDAEESDVFILSGAEDLVPALVKSTDGHWVREPLLLRTINNTTYSIRRYRPRIEGLFARIERWTNTTDASDSFWRSISKDNITTWYGRSAESRITDPADPHRVFSWLICESHDDKGNVAVYGYKTEDSAGVKFTRANERNRVRTANRYLKRIRYGNRVPYFPKLTDAAPWPTPPAATAPDGSDHWLFEVVFDYGEHDNKAPTPNDPGLWSVRNDPFSSYRSGFEVRTYRLCRRALMFHHFKGEKDVGSHCLVRSTDFEYSSEEFPKDARNPVYSFLLSITQTGYKRKNDTYFSQSFPPVKFAYTDAVIDPTVHTVAPESLENLPLGLDGSAYEWVDLDGEGLSGILSEQAGAWFYKRNLSPLPRRDANGAELPIEARFDDLELVSRQPTVSIAAGHARFMDLAGDGQPDVVQLDGPVPGFFERTEDAGWEPFRPFNSWPNIDPHDTNLRFVDLDGDGHADILITEDDVFRWHASLAENGFGPEERVDQSFDEEAGPHLVFADGTQSIYLADLSGDGLSDLVRIRNGEVCYWPNLGYGRFGAKVTMDNSPWFDAPDQFDQRRIRLVDIDGSGTTDIIYLNGGGPRLYFNQSGNSWSPAHTLTSFPSVDNLASIQALDLLGNGTACLVWSSPLPGNVGRQMRYIDLMGGEKPHLLTSTVNNIGAETRVEYAPSTKFYLQDKQNGKPWVTRLPFPVHVVERVITYDYINRNRFVTRYAYHHGYFDGPEREFRGFGCVEQWDTEQFAALTGDSAFLKNTNKKVTNNDKSSHVPPVRTVTWFHTGAFIDEARISCHMAHEYYGAPSEDDPDLENKWSAFESKLLPDTILPADALLPDGSRDPSLSLTADELREAVRALKGSVLRQEVYAEDGSTKAPLPYTVSERNYTLECFQPRGDNRYGVFFAHARETIDYDHERNPADPRVSHAVTLKVDGFGNVLKSVAIGYGRRTDAPDPVLTAADRADQKRIHVTCTENEYTEAIQADDDYRAPLIAGSCTSEVLQVSPGTTKAAARQLFGFDEIAAKIEIASDGKHEILYEDTDAASVPDDQPCRRLIERVHTLYRSNDLTGLLPLKQLHSRALPGESFKLAFTPGLLASVFSRKRPDGTAEDLLPDPTGILGQKAGEGGGYVDLDGDNHWWIPTGRIFYSPINGETAAAELTCAREHFFLQRRYRDPFHSDQFPTETTVTYDPYDLLTQETQDALGNRVTVGERDKSGALTAHGNDYRVLQPRLITDPNGNRSEVVFDALGLVAGTAAMGKNLALGLKAEGDLLDDHFVADPSQKQIADFLDDPLAQASGLLAKATSRIIYDLDCFQSTSTKYPDDLDQWQPAFAATLVRETHFNDPLPEQGLKIQVSFSYSDGFGREIQKKLQAEPEKKNGVIGPPRWIGSGWTIFNNKGKPVRQYEPFFDETHRFKFGEKVGVSPVLFYDPVERVVATLHPNNTFEKIQFDSWQQITWDVNDTVLLDPRTDLDVHGYAKEYFASEPQDWKTWLRHRIPDPQNPPADSHGKTPDQDVAVRALAHANTPTVSFFDSLGRTFLTVADNGPDENATPRKYRTHTKLDIENNEREVVDAKGRVVMRYDYDMLSNRIHQASMEAGERWRLNDVAGKPLYAWDSRGHQFRTIYDRLRRPTGSCLLEGTGPELTIGVTVYGESLAAAETSNLRGKVYQVSDQAGVVITEKYDFKGNLLTSTRQLAVEYKATLDWSKPVALESETYSSGTAYDALNRQVALTMADASVVRHSYNEANLLEKIEANLRGTSDLRPFVANIDYNEKGQRQLIEYGILDGGKESRVKTEYQYDEKTFRLTHILTTRDDNDRLQSLNYVYDPVGNITSIREDAQEIIYFKNKRVEPSTDYIYDAIYRLTEARGREHLGQTAGHLNVPTPSDAYDAFRTNLAHPGDGNAMGTYIEKYVYDAVGNILSMQHRGSGPINPGWTRTYLYTDASLLEPARKSNRLSSTRVGQMTETYAYSGNEGLSGNITSMPHLSVMRWNYNDQLQATARQVVDTGGVPETTWYAYDNNGQRVRKVTECAVTATAAKAGKRPVRLKERLYLRGFEIYKGYNASDGSKTLERESIHIMDDKRRVALVETKTFESGLLSWLNGILSSPTILIRYQFDNHLGSACLEVDNAAAVISYEEFYPYGSTSYAAVEKSVKAEAKRYRYTSKERDEENGLYYYEARYYASWLGRWTSPDPAALIDGPNLFSYVHNNPVRSNDLNGLQENKDPIVGWGVRLDFAGNLGIGPLYTAKQCDELNVLCGSEINIFSKKTAPSRTPEEKPDQTATMSSTPHLARGVLEETIRPQSVSGTRPRGTLHTWSGQQVHDDVLDMLRSGSSRSGGWMMEYIEGAPTPQHAKAAIEWAHMKALRAANLITQQQLDAAFYRIWGLKSAWVVGSGAASGHAVESHGTVTPKNIQGAYELKARAVGGGIRGLFTYGTGLFTAISGAHDRNPGVAIALTLFGVGEVTSGIVFGSGAIVGSAEAMTIGTAGASGFGGAAAAVGFGVAAYRSFKSGDTVGGVINTAGAVGGGLMIAATILSFFTPVGWLGLIGLGLAALAGVFNLGKWLNSRRK